MSISSNRWKKLFLFGLGLSMGTAFCMKWMETDLWLHGERFTIIGLELFYSKEKLMAIMAGLDGHVKTILSYHLHFDFAFMAGVYPGIAALCMMAGEKLAARPIKNFFFLLAVFQFLAWAGDITENLYLLKWLRHPVIGNEFGLYHFIVATKWIIALSAVLFSIPVVIWHKTKKR
jgi:hypothetical protein